ncbi:MAG: alpha/beta hydrolase [Acidobacteria bacterium]|nr:alpha/beta hydrolase [Acidobacteriota bacterium]
MLRLLTVLALTLAAYGQDSRDVAYGPHPRNVLDFYRAPLNGPSPVVVFIHGGGFVNGSKAQLNAGMRDRLLQAGISVAAINYRYATQASFPAPMMDGVRAIQFLRWKAKEWDIDKGRIAAMGGSAGACMSLWIGYHDDFANPKSEDPVERESSRLSAMAVNGAQTTLDPEVLSELISPAAARHPSGPPFFGIPQGESGTPRAREVYRLASPVTYLTRDDPPAWLYYDEPDVDVPANARPGTGIHHPRFGRYLRERCQPLGLTCEVRLATDYQDTRGAGLEQFEFLRRHLLGERR